MAETSLDPAQHGKVARARRPWVAPRIEPLPRLTELTLQTCAIDGTCGGGGTPSTVF
jgi:hypothetical protein